MALSKKDTTNCIAILEDLIKMTTDKALVELKEAIWIKDEPQMRAILDNAVEAERTLRQAKATLEYHLQEVHKVLPKGRLRASGSK